MQATMTVVTFREREPWPLVVDAPCDTQEEQTMTVFRAMAIWIGLELAVIGAVITVV